MSKILKTSIISAIETRLLLYRNLIANSLNDHFSSVFGMESKTEKMSNFKLITDKKLSVDLIMQKLSVIEVEKR